MAYGYNMQINACAYCPYMTRQNIEQNPDMQAVKKVGNTEVTYDTSQYRILPLLALPFLFYGAGAPGPFWGPPQYFYNYYWYYYR